MATRLVTLLQIGVLESWDIGLLSEAELTLPIHASLGGLGLCSLIFPIITLVKDPTLAPHIKPPTTQIDHTHNGMEHWNIGSVTNACQIS